MKKKWFNIFAIFTIIIGVIAQAMHPYYNIYDSSTLIEPIKSIQAGMLSLFVTIGVVFFALRSGFQKDVKNKEKDVKVSYYFATFESVINLHYWTKEQIYDPYVTNSSMLWYEWSILVIYSIAIPVIISLFAKRLDFTSIEEDPSTIPLLVKGIETVQNKIKELTNNDIIFEVKGVKKDKDNTFKKANSDQIKLKLKT